MPLTNEQTLMDSQIDQFRRDGFVAMRQLFSADEVSEIRDTFMDANRDGPVPGLSEIKEYKADDPLSRYPRMMHPHRHPELPVGPIAVRYMLHPRLHVALRTLMNEE